MTDRFTKSEKSTEHFVKSQFPDFFLDEGEGIVDFIDSYYKHFSANTGNKIRDLQFQGDIDTTSNTNLIRFNNKYTFGSGRFIKELPAVITGDLRFIIKNIKDLYRSKGTERGIKLFFRLAFNDSPEVFVPGRFLFRPSDSNFNRPDIIEINLGDGNSFSDLVAFEGTEIVGSISGASAIAKNIFRKRNGKFLNTYIELDRPQGSFTVGDAITARGAGRSIIVNAPTVSGPISNIVIESGAENVPLGTVFTALPRADGTQLKVSVTETDKVLGTFFLRGVTGYGYSSKSNIIVTRAPGESSSIDRGTFSVVTDGAYSTHIINGDLLRIYDHQTIGTANVNGLRLDGTGAVNLTSGSIEDALSNDERTYGKILRIAVNEEPKNYNGISSPFVAIKDITFSANQAGNASVSGTLLNASHEVFANSLIRVANTLSGNVTISIGNNKVIGTGTSFESDFNDHDVIKIINDDGLPTFHNIDRVDSDTMITLLQNSPFSLSGNDYTKGFLNFIKLIDSNGKTFVRAVNNFVDSNTVYLDDKILSGELASNPSYTFRIGYNTANVNFSDVNDKLKRKVKSGTSFTEVDTGIDADFDYKITSALDSVSNVNILSSGFGYEDGSSIFMRSEDLTPLVNIDDRDGTGSGAVAIPTLSNGKITSILVLNGGSGYGSPVTTIEGGTGSGALITATTVGGIISDIKVTNQGNNYFSSKDITVQVNKHGQSILEGRHTSINSELNPKIRVTDSDYWQEFSYEIESTIDSEKYKDTVDGLVHMAGRKFFTKNVIKDEASSTLRILEESVANTGI